MRTILTAGILLAMMAGCQGTTGPFTARAPVRVDDPCLDTREQQRLGRENLAIPDPSEAVGPYAGTPRPGVWGAPVR